MLDLTIVTSCRNKDYGRDPRQGGRVYKSSVDFVHRFEHAVSANLKQLRGIDFEWIIVDWASPGIPMHKVDFLREVMDHHRIRHYVVGTDVGKAEGLNPVDGFYEHFAKNVGLRRAQGRYVLVLNGDVILDVRLADSLRLVLDTADDAHFFRPTAHVDVDPETDHILNEVALDDKKCYDWMVAANYGGNFLLTSRKVMLEVARGFDETNPKHREEFWHRSGMDGEILWQMHRNGVTLCHLPGAYYHLFHGKPPEGMHYNQEGYENKPDWGFVKYREIEEGPAMRITV